MSAIWRIVLLWRGRWGWLAAGIGLSIASLACLVALLGLAGAGAAQSLLGLAVAGGVALRVLGPSRVVLRYAERLLAHDAMFRALADVRVWFFRGLSRGAAGGLGFFHAGDALSRLVDDVEALDGLYLRILVPLIGAVVLLPVLLVLAARVDPALAALVFLLFASAAFALPALAGRIAFGLGERMATARAGLQMVALDLLSGLREVRAFGAEGRMLAAMQAREATLLGVGRALQLRTARAGALALLAGQGALLAILALGGNLPVAAAVLLFVSVAAFEAVAVLPRAGVLAGSSVAAARRVAAAATAPPPVPEPSRPAPLPDGHGVRFEAVGFAWRPDRPNTFYGLTLDIPQGSRIALVGPSGSGKSTLAALVLKVVAPQAGRVLLGGTDIATLDTASVRRRVAWLSQTTHLFDDTIRANLRLGAPEAPEAALWAALETARVADFVRALPDQLDTWLGEAGTRVSGGEGRRIALARALLSPAPILLLDEPCTGLDAETERAFLATLNDVAADRTIMLIVHRLTGVERLDRVWRLAGGRAVAAAA